MRRIPFAILSFGGLSCLSMPAQYDTASAPDGGKAVAGVSVVAMGGTYEVPTDDVGLSDPQPYTLGGLRGDFQAGYGFARAVEVGFQSGLFAGVFSSDGDSPSYTATFQGDLYPYGKFALSSGNLHFALKLAAGGGLVYMSGDAIPFPILGVYSDLLVGMGDPEKFTFGIRASTHQPHLSLLFAFRVSGLIFGSTAGFVPMRGGYRAGLYIGVAKAL